MKTLIIALMLCWGAWITGQLQEAQDPPAGTETVWQISTDGTITPLPPM
jgi:hypothetical protein